MEKLYRCELCGRLRNRYEFRLRCPSPYKLSQACWDCERVAEPIPRPFKTLGPRRIVKPTPPSTNEGFVYLAESNGLLKIGRTKNVTDRMASHAVSNPHIKLVRSYRTNHYKHLELWLHERFSQSRVSGEWFNITPNQVYRAILEYPEELVLDRT